MSSSTDRSFVHLHVHSEHSALDSTARVGDIIAAAKADGQEAVAITDHGSLASIFDAMKAGKEAGVKVIPGLEAYLAIGSRMDPQTIEVPAGGASTDSGDEVSGKTKIKRYHHLTILATTPAGWRNLVAMHNASQQTRIGKHPAIDYDLLAEHSEGLVALTGCLGGPVLGPLARGDKAGARQGLEDIIGAVGHDNVYVEVMDHGIEEESAVLGEMAKLAKSYNLPLIATNDAHHARVDGARAHEAWLATQTQKTLADPSPPRFAFTGHGYHMRTGQEMRAVRGEKWWAKACDNTSVLAGRVAGDMMPEQYLRLPKFPVPGGFKDSREYFIHLVKAGAKARYGDPYSDEVAKRLNTEMRVLSDFGVIDYFLIVHELISWARSQGILVGPGRGSSAGSVASYALGIVNVDPLRFDLLFERFLDPTRIGMPDIDVDFEKARRGEVLAHLVDMYGEEFVARIGTFQVSKTKASLKSAARVLSHPASLGDKLSKVVPMKGADSFTFTELDAQRDGAAAGFWEAVEADTRAEDVVELARQFEQVTTGPSIHACGVVISDVPLTDLVPMRRDTGKNANPEDPAITEWDADGVDAGIGLLKLDVLGIRNLDIIAAAVRTISELTGEVIDPDDLPDGDDLDDERVLKTWQLIARGHTSGLFQLESRGMTELAQDVSPSSLEHLSALVALFRPGPLSANMHTIYAARKNGREDIDYGIFTHDKAEQAEIAKVLGDTFGLCIAEGQRVHSITRGALVPIEDIKPGEAVQGVATDNSSATGTVTRVIDNGVKPVSEARFGGGFTLRATEDHRVLTPEGWMPLNEVCVGGLVAVPKDAIEPDAPSEGLNPDRAKMLGYLIANGSLTYGSHVYLATAEDAIAEGYTAAVQREFPDCHIGSHTRPNGVMSVSVTNGNGNGGKAGPMLAWMRELGLKFPIGSERGGLGSSEKFIPATWLAAPGEMAAAILAALWDCDGHISVRHGVRYKTVSPTLAEDVRHLLLRLGIPSTIARSTYTGSDSVKRDAFDVLVNRLGAFAGTVGRHLSHPEKRQQCELLVDRTPQENLIPRTYLRDAISGQSVRGFCEEHGVPRSTCSSARPYATERTARPVYDATDDHRLGELLNARWVKLESITPAGASRVWDLEVEGIHSFVASGVIVHNCVYQEQMMMLGDVVAGFGPAERNRLRKGVSKKIASEVEAVGELFMSGATSETASDGTSKLAFSERTASKVWDTIKGGADYAFNKCLTGDTEVESGGNSTWTVEQLYRRLHGTELGPGDTCPRCQERPARPDSAGVMCGRCASWLTMFNDPDRGFSLLAVDSADGRIRTQKMAGVHHNGFRQVFRVTLADGRQVRATDNHRFMDADMRYAHVRDITPGRTSLATIGDYEVHRYQPEDYRLSRGQRQGVGRLYGPGKENIGYIDGASIALKTWTEQTIDTASCGQCGKTRSEGRLERAHLDGDRTNNTPDNLRWLCVSHHKAHDYRHNGRRRRWQKGRPVESSMVVSVESAGVEPVYDIEMAPGTDHNFVANGIVSHNSHSAAYGQVAYVTAFLKANWPAAFGAAVLAQTDDDEKRAAILGSLAAEGIRVLPPQVNSAQFATTATDAHTVVLGLGETKDVGKAALAIIAERDQNGPFTGPADILSRTRTSGKDGKAAVSLTSTTLAALIEAGAMDEFGPRLGQMRVLRALRSRPDSPVPRDEWGLVERAVRQHQRLGLSLGQHPMSAISDQVRGWNPDLQDQWGNPLGSKPMPLHRVLSSGRKSVVTIGLVTGWKVKADNRGGQRATLHLEGSKGRIEAVVWDNTLRALRRSGHSVGVGSVIGVLASVRTREIEQRDEEGNTATALVHTLTVSRMWPLDYTDVDAHAPSGGLELALAEHLFSPLQAAQPAPSGSQKVPTSAVFTAPEVAPEPEPVEQELQEQAIFVESGELPSGPAKLPTPPNEFYEPASQVRTYLVEPTPGCQQPLLVVSLPEDVAADDLSWQQDHMSAHHQAQGRWIPAGRPGWSRFEPTEHPAQVAA